MDRKRIRGGSGVFGLLLLIAILIVATCAIFHYSAPSPKLLHETNITIEHLWEESDKYYFSDNGSFVYEMRDGRAFGRQIMYEDLAKIRFEKLKEGNQYHVKYRCDWDVRVSISEKEIGR